ncbi:MAG: Hsp20/alpha crystallin family protein [Armatimonadota bacterium]
MPFPAMPVTARIDSANERSNEPNPSKWNPAVDIVDTGESLILVLDVPGIEPDDIRIEAEEHRVRILGKRSSEPATDGRRIASERPFGPFERRFRVRHPVDVDRIVARYRKGVLTLQLPRRDRAETRIPVATP